MAVLSSVNEPREMDLLVGYFDLSRFAPYAEGKPATEAVQLLSDY